MSLLSLLVTTDSDDSSGFWYAIAAIILVAIIVAWIAFRVDDLVKAIKDRWGR